MDTISTQPKQRRARLKISLAKRRMNEIRAQLREKRRRHRPSTSG